MNTGVARYSPIALALLCVVLACASTAAAARIVLFQTPSRNIGCAYLPAISRGDVPTLRCEIGSGLRPLPHHAHRCVQGDFGQAVATTRRGRAEAICISDTVRTPSAPVLRYGHTIHVGGVTCTSRRIGLRCTNAAGHGWFLSRQHSFLF